MSGVRKRSGTSLSGLSAKLKDIPRTAAIGVARIAAGKLSSAVLASFDAGQTAYDSARPLGSSGNKLTLVQTGRVRGLLRFLSDGTTKIRANIGVPYMRYLIRYGILPVGPLPIKWRAIFDAEKKKVLDAEVAKL